MRTCIVPGCERPYQAKGLCHTHYQRVQDTGSVNADVPFKKRRPEHTGLRQNPMYNVWHSMIRRCTDPRAISYKNYGGRGIMVCERWMVLLNFIEDMHPRPEGTTIDRIDGTGNYEKSNCRWATPKEQSNNLRSNRRITFAEETLTITEWAKRLDVDIQTIRQRLDLLGWSVEKALTTPSRFAKSA